MRRKHVSLTGNALMVLGLAVVIAGIGYAVLNQLPQLHLPQVLANAAIFGIFIGALMWLIGARLSGREKITDHYYWVRHYGDKRCRRASDHGHHQ
ncbi:stress-induced protein YchH [Erwinia phyllosphaerae]|uniref:stress-induced protein YchH n=1 Tax=Erwinia phyllosphaerae TaxID=2853256 RepID=UPI001FEE0AFA|nr:stress-induced protein YchH [Erwinia phyllosphaerae]MBV4366433.1 stress-induced protein YchH [Erwinia phyllosphaerae]